MWHGFFIRRTGMLRIFILNSLKASPKNGAEIINHIEMITLGWWRPSPGSIYPLLEKLVEEGLIVKRQDGRYELTEKGKSEISFSFPYPEFRIGAPRTLDEILMEIDSYLSYIEDLKTSSKDEVEKNREKIKNIIERFQKILAS